MNKGFEKAIIDEYRDKIKKGGNKYVMVDSEDNSDEYVNFLFIGMYEGKEVIYDAVIYTLRLHHNSELYEVAEHRAAQHFPEYRKIKYEEDENGDLSALDDLEEEIGLYMAEIMMELEEDGQIKVKEHVEIDPHLDFGIGIDAALNIEKITPKTINSFVESFNNDTLELDSTLYSFQTMDEEVT